MALPLDLQASVTDPTTTTLVPTSLAQRKAAEAERRRRAAETVVDGLRAYAVREGGRFVVFGSYRTDGMRFDSDLDILIDFPPETAGSAWRFVEEICAEHGVPPDIHDALTSRPAFTERVKSGGLALP